MNQKDTGGPAFPSNGWDETGQFPAHFMGMTLRQYVAIHAMQGILANSNCMPERQAHFDNIAVYALQAADTLLAMLEARK